MLLKAQNDTRAVPRLAEKAKKFTESALRGGVAPLWDGSDIALPPPNFTEAILYTHPVLYK